MPVTKISMPIIIRIIPPSMLAFEAKRVPKRFPIYIPGRQTEKVTTAIIIAQTRAFCHSYSAMVNPTLNASIEVATPYNKTAAIPIFLLLLSSCLLILSKIILPPINKSNASEI